MLKRSRPAPPRIKVGRKLQPNYARPNYARPIIQPFPEEEGAFSFARRLVGEYADMEDGHHGAVRQFLQRCYVVVLKFQCEPDEFKHLKADPFWEASRHKPKDASTSKWVLYFVMRATTPNVRNRAGRHAVLLDGLIRDKVKPGAVAARIKEMGGVEVAYEAMRARKRGDAERSQSREEDEGSDETHASTSASGQSTDELFDPEKDLSIRVPRETHLRVLGSEIGVGDLFISNAGRQPRQTTGFASSADW